MEPVTFGSVKKRAVLQLRPTALKRGFDLMLRQCMAQRNWSTLVEEHPHLRRRKRAAGGVLENLTSLRHRDARKPLDKISDQGAVFKVLEQSGDWYTCANEDPCAANAIGITLYSRTGGPIDHKRQGITAEKSRLTSL